MTGYVQLSWKTWTDVVAFLGKDLDDNMDGTGMAHTTAVVHDACGESAPYLSLRLRTVGGGIGDFRHGEFLGPDTEPGTYRLHTFDRRLRDARPFPLTKLSTGLDGWITFQAGGEGFSRRAADLSRTPEVGDELSLETIGYSLVVGLRDKDGWLFRQSDQQLDDERTAQQAKWEQNRIDTLAKGRETWQAIEDALPAWLKVRIDRFHNAAGETFELDGWGYELIVCQLAELYLADDQDAIKALDAKSGCSGNQHTVAKLLVRMHRQGESVEPVPSALTPITGRPDYAPKKD